MSISKRIASASAANSVSILTTSAVQLVTIPVLAASWGKEAFGIWLMIATLPSYFALTDLGFIQAATSDMTMNAARGNREQVLRTFQSTAILFLATIAAVLSVIGAGLAVLDHSGIAEAQDFPIIATIAVLAVYSGLALLSRLTIAGFRANGLYAQGTLLFDSLVFLEGMIMVAVVLSGGGPLAAATTLLCARPVSMVIAYAVLRRKLPWLHYGHAHASLKEIMRLLHPALGAMTVPAAISVNLQGVVLVIGAVLSPVAVALYTPVRTLSRLAVQLAGIINRATMPEIARAKAQADDQALSRILGLNLAVMGLILLPGCLVFAAIGSPLIALWTGGHIVPPRLFVAIMAAATLAHGLWYFLSNALIATNSHMSLTGTLVTSAPLGLVLAGLGGHLLGLNGVALGLLATELFCLGKVLTVFPWTSVQRSDLGLPFRTIRRMIREIRI
jgi:O-antigen/teichoic acid export membrane protein